MTQQPCLCGEYATCTVCLGQNTEPQPKKTIVTGDVIHVAVSGSSNSIPVLSSIEPSETVKKAVDHPSHYVSGGMEAIDVIEAFKLGFNLGNAVKYILRAGRKDDKRTLEDLEKAIWYIRRRIEKGTP